MEFEGEEIFVAPAHPANAAATSRETKSVHRRKMMALNFPIKKRTECAALKRRIGPNELCLDARCGTTVRKDKISYETPEQDGEDAKKLASPSGKRMDDALTVLAACFLLRVLLCALSVKRFAVSWKDFHHREHRGHREIIFNQRNLVLQQLYRSLY